MTPRGPEARPISTGVVPAFLSNRTLPPAHSHPCLPLYVTTWQATLSPLSDMLCSPHPPQTSGTCLWPHCQPCVYLLVGVLLTQPPAPRVSPISVPCAPSPCNPRPVVLPTSPQTHAHLYHLPGPPPARWALSRPMGSHSRGFQTGRQAPRQANTLVSPPPQESGHSCLQAALRFLLHPCTAGLCPPVMTS